MMITSTSVSKDFFEQEEDLAKRFNDTKVELKAVKTKLGAHPEGVKRGGSVPVYSEGQIRIFWDEGGWQWVAYDDEQ